jgi:signal transduction histidine kinase
MLNYFKQVMMNLIKNGIEAIPNGEMIQVLTVQDGEPLEQTNRENCARCI